MTTKIDRLHKELDQALEFNLQMIQVRAAMAEHHLDDLVELMNLRADYEWFRSQVLSVMPLGIQSWIDERLVRKWAEKVDCDHIADALIEELALMGSGNALNRLNRALASIDRA